MEKLQVTGRKQVILLLIPGHNLRITFTTNCMYNWNTVKVAVNPMKATQIKKKYKSEK